MAYFKPAVITHTGVNMLANDIAGIGNIEFIKMVTGAGEYTEEEKAKNALKERTALKDPRQEFAFNAIEVKSDRSVLLKSVISNVMLEEGYRITEVGVYAREKGTEGSGFLYSLTLAIEADFLPPFDGEAPLEIVQEYYATVSDSAAVSIVSAPGVFALYEDMKALESTVSDRLKVLTDIISREEDTFSDKAIYDLGDYCIHNKQLYKCIVSIVRPGEWDETYWEKTTITEELLYLAKTGGTGGAGGTEGSSIDIIVSLPAAGWTGEAAPYSQTITVPQMREGMTPLIYFAGTGDDAQYAYSLITGYEAGYAQMIFYAADLPEADIPITLKGIPAQQLEYADNTVVVVVPADGFELNEDLGRYEQTITVEGMTPGMGGLFDIVRSGPVLTLEESKIVASITDIIRLDGAIKIVCLEPPAQQYMLALYGTFTQATEGTTLLAGMQGWFDKVEEVSAKTNVNQAELFSFAGGITVDVFRAYRVGHTITFHMECVATSNIPYGSVIGTFKSPYRPGINYIIVPVRNNSSSFSEIATLWIRSNGNCELYGNTVTSGIRFYIQGSFTY